MINWGLVFALLLLNNVVLTNGFGSLSLQQNKNNLWFTLLNSFCVLIISVVCCCLYNLVYTYLLDPYNIEKIGLVVMIALSGLFNFIILEIIKLSNKEMYYYYDTTYSFIINLGTVIGIMFCLDYTITIVEVLANSAIVGLGYFIVSMLFAFVYEKLHNKKVSRMVRPVPIIIVTIAVLAMIIYAITISI